jgi:SAM-dependent methyltransferase
MSGEYSNQTGFWIRDKPRVMGDLIGRPRAIEFLGDIDGLTVLESGCGEGYVARALARRGAIVSGCDLDEKMLSAAEANELDVPLGIKYTNADIRSTLYREAAFDRIISVGVLFSCDCEGLGQFVEDAYRILTPKGEMVISTTHPFMFTPGSPSRGAGPNWLKHEPIDNLPYENSQRFRELYTDIDGNVFPCKVWHHPVETYVNILTRGGFVVDSLREHSIEKKHLLVPSWGREYGYPAFLQIKAKK